MKFEVCERWISIVGGAEAASNSALRIFYSPENGSNVK